MKKTVPEQVGRPKSAGQSASLRVAIYHANQAHQRQAKQKKASA